MASIIPFEIENKGSVAQVFTVTATDTLGYIQAPLTKVVNVKENGKSNDSFLFMGTKENTIS